MEIKRIAQVIDSVFHLELNAHDGKPICVTNERRAIQYLEGKTKCSSSVLLGIWNMKCNKYYKEPLTERVKKAIEKFKFYNPKLFETL